ncbi:hypothetical protein ACN28S_30010 [Cystobacter fuscus]
MKLNGIICPVLNEVQLTYAKARQSSGRGVTGTYFKTQKGQRGIWEFTTEVMPLTEARAWEGLLSGQYDTWNFDAVTANSARSLQPITTNGVIVTNGGRFGSPDHTYQVNGLTSFNLGLLDSANQWSCSFMMKTAAVWAHWCVIGGTTPVFYKDGIVVAAPAYVVFGVSNGRLLLHLYPNNGSSYQIDELVAFRFAIPSSWVSQIRSYMLAQKYPVAPYLELVSEAQTVTKLVKATVGEVTASTLTDGDVGEVVPFTVMER